MPIRIIASKGLTQRKFGELSVIAMRLGKVRTEVWDRFGSIAGTRIRSFRAIRDEWVAEGRDFGVSARVWKETLSDVFNDIKAHREASKEKVKKCVQRLKTSQEEKKSLYRKLSNNSWVEDSYLRRKMRKYFKHGHTSVCNQIILDKQSYNCFTFKGKPWIEVISLTPRKKIAIPLNSTFVPTGTLRLILKDEKVYIHHLVEVTDQRPCGDQTVGIDKGYTEAFTDSDGVRHGEGLGKLLTDQSDKNKVKYQRRNKLKALAAKYEQAGNFKKRDNIVKHNLGRVKLGRAKARYESNVKHVVFNAVHSIVDKADVIGVEDLTFISNSKKTYSKNQKRRLSNWVKGLLQHALDSVASRRGASVVVVNAAYTSQTDSRNGCLLGTRRGDLFHCFDGVVLDADHNAALNVKDRISDPDITRFMPFCQVKQILLKRTKSRLGPLNLDSSFVVSQIQTESELPES